MTMPDERTRALIAAGEFLLTLRVAPDTPAAIRAQVIHVLRHYPSESSILMEARKQLGREKDGVQPWLLPRQS